MIKDYLGIKFDHIDDHVNITMNKSFLIKSNCELFADHLISENIITRMSKSEIAEEIYAHAVCFYWYTDKNDIFHKNKISKELHDHGEDGIWIQSGGDTAIRKSFYKILWTFSF